MHSLASTGLPIACDIEMGHDIVFQFQVLYSHKTLKPGLCHLLCTFVVNFSSWCLFRHIFFSHVYVSCLLLYKIHGKKYYILVTISNMHQACQPFHAIKNQNDLLEEQKVHVIAGCLSSLLILWICVGCCFHS
ncbi:hypothetical protein ACJX0J_009286 [Zea mays]